MADIQANIGIGVDTTQALASIRQLQREISAFHTSLAKGGALANAESSRLSQNLVNTINASGKFSAGMTNISSSTESFTNALEKNKLSMGQYFRYAGGSSKTFGKMFTREFNTISRVATERVKDLQTQYISMGRDANGALQSLKVRPLALDMNNLGTKVQIAAQKQQIFNQVLRQGSTNLLNFGKNTQWAGRQLMMGFTLPLAIFGATAIKEFKKIEEQAVKFKRVYGDMFNTNAETDRALDKVKQLAEEFTKYGIAVEKTIGLAAKAAQMGNTGAALTAQVTEATRLAVLGGLEQEEALDTTISLTNAFGIATEDLAGKIDFLNAAENQTILAIEDFNTAIPLSGSVVKQLGGDVEDLAVLLTAMREGGINASQAGNALKSSLARLIAPSRNAKETLSGFGIDVLGIVDNNAGNLMGTINTLAHSLNELDPLSRAKAIESLFGKFQFARMSTLFSNIVKEGSQASKVLGLTANNAAELGILAERELKRVEESPAFKLSKQMEKLQAALAPIGAEFVKIITPIVEFGTKILKAFNNMGEGGKQFIVVLTAIAGVIAPAALMAFGLVANGIANLIKFFQFLGNAFGTLSGKSTLLGGQTEYMTQQQIEAAAVAASLGQSHSNLTQIFTSEASAIRGLTAAYKQAVVAQNMFRGSAGGMGSAGKAAGPTPKKYASGVTMVPGPKGKGDIIPAMLSPGEAVIPVDQTAKYFPLIQGIVADNLPGYASSNLPQPVAFKGKANLMHQQSGKVLNMDEASQISGPVAEAATGFRLLGETTKNLAVKMEMQSKEFNLKSLWGMKGDAALNQQSQSGSMLEDLKTDMGSRSSGEIWSEGVQGGGVNPAEALDDMEEYNKEYRRQIDMANNGQAKYFTDTEENLQQARARLGDQFKSEEWTSQERLDQDTAASVNAKNPKNKVLRARAKARASFREARTYTPSRAAWKEGLASEDPRISEPMRKKFTQKDSQTGKPKIRSGSFNLNKTAKEDASRVAGSAQKAGIAAGDGLVDGAETSLQISSPSKRMFQIGKDAAQGLINGTKETLGKLKGKTMQVGQGIGEKINASPTAQRAADYLGGYDLDKTKSATDKAAQATSDAAEATGESTEATNNLVKTTEQKAKEDKAVLKESKRQNRQNRAGKALGALGTATMVAGMATQVDGKVGEVAKGLVGPMAALSGIAPMLMALPAPIAALVAVIGAGVAIWYLYNRAMDKAYDKTYDLSRAMGSSTEAMNKFAEFAGTVTAGENMAKRREGRLSNYATAPGKQTFGSAYLESDSGQEFANSVRSSLTSLGKDQTVSMIFQQMGAAISQNILTAEQARSIVGNLGIELSNLSLSAEVNSQLVSVFGPNGENLLEEPLVIPAIMAEMQTEALAKTFEEYQATTGILAFENVGLVESTQRLLDDALGVVGVVAGPLVEGALRSTGMANTDESYQDAVGEERQRRIDSGEVEGWWAETMLRMTPDTTIADEMMQANLGKVSGNMQNSLENQQSLVDSMRVASEDRINKAIEEGADYSAIAELREEESEALEDAIAKIREQTQTTIDFIDGLETKDQETVRNQQRDRLVDNAPEGTDKGALGKALDDLFSSGDFGANFTLSSAYEAGQLTLDQLMYLADLPPAQKDIYYNISTNLGAGEAAQIMQVAETIKDETVRQQFELSFDGLDGTELTDAIAMSEQLAKMSTLFSGDLSIPVGFMLKPENEEAMASFMANMDKITLDASEGGWDKNIELVTSILGAEEVAAAQRGIMANQAEFDALPDEMQLQYGAYFTLFMDMAVEDGALLEMAEAATGLTGDDAVAAWVMDIMPAMATDNSTSGDAPDPKPTGGGAEKSVDSLLKKLRDLRIATIDMKKGWEGMQEVLAKTFGGTGGGIDIFDGLSNQIRKMGVGENLIEMIVGMDPDEYAKRKDELFTFDNAGNITGTTSKLKNLSSAFNSIAIGEYVNSQQAFIENTKNQFNAMNTLVASGMSLAESYELVQDEALAAAIAMGATSEEIKEIIRITSLMKEQQERSKKEQERIDASKAVKETNKEFNNQIVILNKLAKAKGQYSDEEIQAILGDSNLGKLFLDPSIDPQSLKKALENARRRADLELQIKVSTDEGKEGLFNELVSEISNEFSRQETKIQLEFDVSTKDDSDIAKQAQNQIAEIQYQLDDYNAELEQISWVEDDINEKYDKRAEALEDIAKANGKIAAQQKAQLSIADALSQGDISAAARAAQELKEQQAGSAQEDQKAMLDRAREAELASARAPGGMSRADIEDEITALERKRFLIEEQSLEPAQERIRIAEHNKELQIAALEVSGKTRSEWEQISSQVDIATQNTEEFAKSVERALALFEHFVNGADLDSDLFGGDLKAQAMAMGAAFKEPPPPPPPAPAPRTGGGQTSSSPAKVTQPGSSVARAIQDVVTAQKALTKTQTAKAPSIRQVEAAAAKSRAAAARLRAAELAAKKPASSAYLFRASGGIIPGYNVGGRVKGYAAGGYSMGSDIVPAMLTPGEFVVRKRAVQNFGMDNLEKINSGSYADGSVYTYNLAVNVNSESDPSRIARAVMTQIKQVDSQRIRNNKL